MKKISNFGDFVHATLSMGGGQAPKIPCDFRPHTKFFSPWGHGPPSPPPLSDGLQYDYRQAKDELAVQWR